MLAIDTNIIIRYLTADHPEQAAQARQFVDGAAIFVSSTVLLETEWVLRSAYGYPAAQCARALRAFGGLPGVTLEDPASAARALDWMEAGLDFADALHLAKAEGCEAFLTFDQRFARAAGRLGATKVIVPGG